MRYILVVKNVAKDPAKRGDTSHWARYYGVHGWGDSIAEAGPFDGLCEAREMFERAAPHIPNLAIAPLRKKTPRIDPDRKLVDLLAKALGFEKEGWVGGDLLAAVDKLRRERDEAQEKLAKLFAEPESAPSGLMFEVGDVWEWTDARTATANGQRVGWPVRVRSTIGSLDVLVDLLGETQKWGRKATEGLKLIERGGKPYTGPQP